MNWTANRVQFSSIQLVRSEGGGFCSAKFQYF